MTASVQLILLLDSPPDVSGLCTPMRDAWTEMLATWMGLRETDRAAARAAAAPTVAQAVAAYGRMVADLAARPGATAAIKAQAVALAEKGVIDHE